MVSLREKRSGASAKANQIQGVPRFILNKNKLHVMHASLSSSGIIQTHLFVGVLGKLRFVYFCIFVIMKTNSRAHSFHRSLTPNSGPHEGSLLVIQQFTKALFSFNLWWSSLSSCQLLRIVNAANHSLQEKCRTTNACVSVFLLPWLHGSNQEARMVSYFLRSKLKCSCGKKS